MKKYIVTNYYVKDWSDYMYEDYTPEMYSGCNHKEFIDQDEAFKFYMEELELFVQKYNDFKLSFYVELESDGNDIWFDIQAGTFDESHIQPKLKILNEI